VHVHLRLGPEAKCIRPFRLGFASAYSSALGWRRLCWVSGLAALGHDPHTNHVACRLCIQWPRTHCLYAGHWSCKYLMSFRRQRRPIAGRAHAVKASASGGGRPALYAIHHAHAGAHPGSAAVRRYRLQTLTHRGSRARASHSLAMRIPICTRLAQP
jgi:hypothetical protein